MIEARVGRSAGAGADLAGLARGIATAADRERLARYAEALAFYQGEQWVGRRRRGETRLTFNYARALVRKVASYVFPAPVTFSVPANAEGEAVRDTGAVRQERAVHESSRQPTGGVQEAANRAERALARVAADLDLAQLDIALCVDASVLGDGALKVTWDAARGRPVVAAVDPATLFAVLAPDDPRQVERVAQVYQLSGAAVERLFKQPSPPGSLSQPWEKGGRQTTRAARSALGLDPGRAYAVVEEWTAERWRVEVAGQLLLEEANPYGWLPYVIAPNNPRPHAFWGESDLVDLYDVCRELNARLSVLAKVLELSGAPIAVLENVDGSEGIAVGPGAKWELPEGAKAYLLDLLGGGGVGLHIEFVNLLYRSLHDLSETPRTAFGDSGRDLSGAALEVEVQPLVQKVHRQRCQTQMRPWCRPGSVV